MKSVADVFRKDETTKMVNGVELRCSFLVLLFLRDANNNRQRTFKTQLTEPVDLALNKPEIDMWDRPHDLISKAEAVYTSKPARGSYGTGNYEVQELITCLLAFNCTELAKLRASFEDSFRYGANGAPRVWKPEDDIDGVFKKARDTTFDLNPLYAKISPTDKGNLPNNLLPNADAVPLPGATGTIAEDRV